MKGEPLGNILIEPRRQDEGFALLRLVRIAQRRLALRPIALGRGLAGRRLASVSGGEIFVADFILSMMEISRIKHRAGGGAGRILQLGHARGAGNCIVVEKDLVAGRRGNSPCCR